MPKARLIFDGDGVYTEKEARIHKLTQETEVKIDNIPGIVDDVNSTSTTDALSANMGKYLQDQINNISGTTIFLSTWDCTTGLPETDPVVDPYTYKTGNYYIVGKVASSGGTNYRPHGASYTHGVPSTAVETQEISVNDWYIYDGQTWVIQPASTVAIVIDDMLKPNSINAVENRAIYSAVSQKQDRILDLATIREGAAAGATAIQPLDNISELTNNVGYQTAGDVASAIDDAIDGSKYVGPTAPENPTAGMLWYDTTNNVLKIYNGSSWNPVDTNTTYTNGYGLNLSSGEFSVDSTVIASKEYVDDSVEDSKYVGPTAPENPVEGMLWYDTTNDVLKVYNGSSWDLTGKVYSAGRGITINPSTDEISTSAVLSSNSTFDNVVYLSQSDYDNLQSKDPGTLYATPDSSDVSIVSNTAYGPSWVGDIYHAPSNNVLYNKLSTMQDRLVSGTNLKTVNNHDLLGSGNIDIVGVEEIQFVTQTEYDNLPGTKTSDGKAYFVYSGHGAAIVSDEPFGSSWNGITTQAPSKNAIYDVLGDVETLLANL